MKIAYFFGALATLISMADAREPALPLLLSNALGQIDTILGDVAKASLRAEDPEKKEQDPFAAAYQHDPFVTAKQQENEREFGIRLHREVTFIKLSDELTKVIEHKLNLTGRWSDDPFDPYGAPGNPDLQEFFSAYLINDPHHQSLILLELYVARLRGIQPTWKTRLERARHEQVLIIGSSWEATLASFKNVDPKVSRVMIDRMQKALSGASQDAEQRGGARQPATATDSKFESLQNPEPESEERSKYHGGEKEPPGSALASRLEGMLDSMSETLYQAQTEIDEENGSLRCDCSGLMGYVLRHEFPEAYLSLRGTESPWRTRPYSVTYYETFISSGDEGMGQGGWRRIRKMMDVRPGDVLAWRKDSIRRGVSTGHTCMIAGLPRKEADGRVRVRVIDSTRKRHANDTRPPGTTGVGAGEMWFIVNAGGEPVGFFVDGQGVQAKSTKVAVGRLIGDRGTPTPSSRATAQQEYVSEPKDARFIGLEKAKAIALAEESELQWRIVREDEVIKPVSMRLRDNRVNFVVAKGRVIRVRRG